MQKIAGPGGLECYRMVHDSGAEATFTRHAGHLISWKAADGIERLFLSEKASFSSGKAIRGGVPVIFPQFSNHGPFGRHGFARKSEWSLSEDGNALELATSPETLTEWPHSFGLRISAALSARSIEISLSIHNPGDTAFEFHAALHTYFAADLRKGASVAGLEGRPFLNEVTKEGKTDDAPRIEFGEEIDRAYHGTCSNPVFLEQGNERIKISADRFPDIVVWNPGPDHGIGDLSPEGWNDFICVEAAQMHEYKTLNPDESWKGSQHIEILS